MGEQRIETVEAAGGRFDRFPGAALRIGPTGQIDPLNERGAAYLAGATAMAQGELLSTAEDARRDDMADIRPLHLGPSAQAVLIPDRSGDVLALIQDTSLERNLREALMESRQRYKELVEISSDFAWETDEAGRFLFVSPRGALGWAAEELLGRAARDFLIDADEAQAAAFTTPEPLSDLDLWFRRADGEVASLSVVASPVPGKGGARGVCRDMTETRARDQALAHAQLRDRLMSHLVRTIRDEIEPEKALEVAVSAVGLAVDAAGGTILRRRVEDGATLGEAASWGKALDPATLDAIGTSLVGSEPRELRRAGLHIAAFPTRYRQDANGGVVFWRTEEDGGFPPADVQLLSEVADQLGVAIAQIVNHERILSLSRTDPMTGLLNRRAFFDELQRRVQRAGRGHLGAAFIYVDMDNFKLVNDNFGHPAGDSAILALCQILRDNSRSNDLAARLGGDEFVLWMEGIDPVTATERTEALVKACKVLGPMTGNPDRPLGVSLGLALYDPRRPETLDQIVARADGAMYKAKQGGKGRAVIADPAPLPAEATS